MKTKKIIEQLDVERYGDIRLQTWATKIGPTDKNGIPKWIEIEIWRQEDPYAKAGMKRKKKIHKIRYQKSD